LVLGVYPS
jgi:hypothetical protein